MSRLSIMFVCNEYPPSRHGGIGSGVQVLARALVRTGAAVRVIGLYGNDSTPDRENDYGVDVVRLRYPAVDKGSIRARMRLFQAVARPVRAGDVDIVEVPDAEGWSVGWPKLNAPVVSRVHGSAVYFAAELGRKVRRLTYFAERASMMRAEFWSAVSRYSATRTRDLFGLRSEGAVLYPLVELPAGLQSTGRRAKKAMYSGTLTLKKGVLSLIDCWNLVARRHPDGELHIFGKDSLDQSGKSILGALQSRLEPQARGSVTFHGHAPRAVLDQCLDTARAAVFPSYAEAFASAPMEAMAHGCATIYTAFGSGRELIEDGRDGLLVDPKQPPEIAGAICSLFDDDTLAQRLGAAGRARVLSQFTERHALPRLQSYYEECIALHRNPGSIAAPLCSSQS